MSDAATYHRGQRNFGTGYDMMVSIEALEAKLALMMFERDEAWKRAAHAEKMWGEAEVKLARAVELAIEECPFRHGTPRYNDWWHHRRATLAEIKGESHEALPDLR